MAIFNSYVKLPEGKSAINGPFSIVMLSYQRVYMFWFVIWNMIFMTFHTLGMSSSQVTNSYFSERLKPPTRNCIESTPKNKIWSPKPCLGGYQFESRKLSRNALRFLTSENHGIIAGILGLKWPGNCGDRHGTCLVACSKKMVAMLQSLKSWEMLEIPKALDCWLH